MMRKDLIIIFGGMKAHIDDVRFLANDSSGGVGLALLRACDRRGIHARVVCGWTERAVHLLPEVQKHHVVYAPTFEEMRAAILKEAEILSQSRTPAVAVFAAAILDFLPVRHRGKLDSRAHVSDRSSLDVTPAPKLIDEFHASWPAAELVSFKLGAGVSWHELLLQAIETNRERQPRFVVANLRESVTASHYEGRLLGPFSNEAWRRADPLAEVNVETISSRDGLAEKILEGIYPNHSPFLTGAHA
jgi:phosphopantothenoylcysteine decarboxylase/phosphopantothenate--cysteine ligase